MDDDDFTTLGSERNVPDDAITLATFYKRHSSQSTQFERESRDFTMWKRGSHTSSTACVVVRGGSLRSFLGGLEGLEVRVRADWKEWREERGVRDGSCYKQTHTRHHSWNRCIHTLQYCWAFEQTITKHHIQFSSYLIKTQKRNFDDMQRFLIFDEPNLLWWRCGDQFNKNLTGERGEG